MELLIKSELDIIISSPEFQYSDRSGKLLEYLVDYSFRNQNSDMKEITIAIDHYGFSSSFDPQKQSLVRNEIYRLRKKLDKYYNKNTDSEIIISIPKGKFIPEIFTKINKSRIRMHTDSDNFFHGLPYLILSAPDCYGMSSGKSYVDFLYHEITSNIYKNKNVNLLSFNTKLHLDAFLNNKNYYEKYKNDVVYLLDLKIHSNSSIVEIYFRLNELGSNRIVWFSSKKIQCSNNDDIRKEITDIVESVSYELLDENGVIYKNLDEYQSDKVMNKHYLMGLYYRLRNHGLNHNSFIFLCYNLEYYLKKYPDDPDILSAFSYVNIYSETEMYDTDGLNIERGIKSLAKGMSVSLNNYNVQIMLRCVNYLSSTRNCIPFFDKQLYTNIWNSPVMNYWSLLYDYLIGNSRGYEEKLLKLGPLKNINFPKLEFVKIVRNIRSDNHNENNLLSSSLRFAEVKMLLSWIVLSCSYFINRNYLLARETSLLFSDYNLDSLGKYLSGYINDEKFIDKTLKIIEKVRMI